MAECRDGTDLLTMYQDVAAVFETLVDMFANLFEVGCQVCSVLVHDVNPVTVGVRGGWREPRNIQDRDNFGDFVVVEQTGLVDGGKGA